MKLNKLEDYVIVIKNAVPKKLCKKALQELKEADWRQFQFYDYKENSHKTLSHEKELETSYHFIDSHDEIGEHLWYAIDKYVKKFKFHWFPGWNGYTKLKYNKYKKGTLMAEHCDHIHDMFDGVIKGIPTLSIIGALNDDYKGGNLIMFENKKYNLKAGDVIIFPSNFLYPHKVTEITKGTRYTYVSCVY